MKEWLVKLVFVSLFIAAAWSVWYEVWWHQFQNEGCPPAISLAEHG